MLEESLKTGLREGFIKKTELNRVNVDSTVQEKAVRYPTDARLYDRMRERLVKSARKMELNCARLTSESAKSIAQSERICESQSIQTGKKIDQTVENLSRSCCSGY